MARLVQFVGGLLWALSRPVRRRRIDRSPSAWPDPAPPPAGRRRRWARRGPRSGWHQWEPTWAGLDSQAGDEGPRRSWLLRQAIRRGAGYFVLLGTVVWLIAVVGMAVTATSTAATVTGATSDGCAVSYTTPDGRHRTGDVDCDDVTVGSTRTVWALSDEPGDVVDPGVLIGVGLAITVTGAVIGAALVGFGRGRRARPGRHEALPVPVSLRVRWWLSRPSRRRPR